MANSPMVIMWSNSDGSITLSQRQAPSEVMPTVVSNPSRVASLDMSGSDLTGSQPKFSFTIEVCSFLGWRPTALGVCRGRHGSVQRLALNLFPRLILAWFRHPVARHNLSSGRSVRRTQMTRRCPRTSTSTSPLGRRPSTCPLPRRPATTQIPCPTRTRRVGTTILHCSSTRR